MNLDSILYKQYSPFSRNLPELLLRAAEVLQLEADKTNCRSTLAEQLTGAAGALCEELGWRCLECNTPAPLVEGKCMACYRVALRADLARVEGG